MLRLLICFCLLSCITLHAQDDASYLGVWKGVMKDSLASFDYTLRITKIDNGVVTGTGMSGNQSLYCETSISGTLTNGVLSIRETAITRTNYRNRDVICLLGMDVSVKNEKLTGAFYPVTNKGNCLAGTALLSFDMPPDKLPTVSISSKKETQKEVVQPQRQLSLIREVIVDAPEAELQVFDNGIVDGDAITLTDNGHPVFTNALLSTTALKYHIDNKETRSHDIGFVADNLGSIPPNTGLLVITANRQRWEINFSSDLSKTAYVRIVLRDAKNK